MLAGMTDHATDRALAAVDARAAWSGWHPFADTTVDITRSAGVYMFRTAATHDIVYVGMAGERKGQGVRGRLSVYRTGKGAVSGLGEAALDRALADPVWLTARLRELEAGTVRRAKDWARLAIERADLEVRWAATESPLHAKSLEDDVIADLTQAGLWNRRRTVPTTQSLVDAVTGSATS